MNNQNKLYWVLPVLFLLVSACEPQITSAPDMDKAPQSSDVTFDKTPDSNNPNIVTFTSTSEGFKFLWDFGNGASADGETVVAKYPIKGDYAVTLTVFRESGQAMNTDTITIAQNNGEMLESPEMNMLTGGIDQVEGKTWVIDSTQVGHMGVGPPGGYTPEWWKAAPGDKSGTGLYTDEYTFILSTLSFEMNTNGKVFLNGTYSDEFPNSVDAPGGDKMAAWEAPSGLNFSFNEAADGTMTLGVTAPSFIGFYAGTQTYQVLTLEENLIELRFEDTENSVVWYHRLIPKGYEHPVPEPEYKSEPLEDTFDTDGNFSWLTNEITSFNESYDNPAPVPVNTSTKVAKYEKGQGMFENVRIDLDYKINLNERNTIKLKAYFPSYNDYTTEDPDAPSWAPNTSLDMQVSVKLQNSESAAPWESQAEVIQLVPGTDSWYELEFDFSGVADRTDFDRIIVQLGGEGHDRPGIFFIDDFQLLP